MKTGWKVAFTYWVALYGTVVHGRQAVRSHLDVPLNQAIVRSRWFTAWNVAVLGLGLMWARPNFVRGFAHHLFGETLPLPPGLSTVVWVTAMLLALPAAYGLFRLFTLVNHIMALNVFRTRGQRLRLLNVETTVSSLSPIVGVGLVVSRLSQPFGYAIIGLTALFALFLLSYGFNLIFHKTGIRGLILLIESYLVTWFVLLMGGLAISVTLAVLAFFVVVGLRLFVHRS